VVGEDRALAKSSSVLSRADDVTSHAANTLLGNEAATGRPLGKEVAARPNVPDGELILAYIYSEMKANTAPDNETFKEIRKNLTLTVSEYLGVIGSAKLFQAMRIFKGQVGYGKPWDQKSYIVGKWGKLSRLSGVLVDYDVWSNIHYGYVGKQAGFKDEILLGCAGIAQAVHSDVPEGWFDRFYRKESSMFAALDDPRDQEAVKIGLELSRIYGDKLSQVQLSNYLRANLGRIRSLGNSGDQAAPHQLP
jgi:Bacterial toxin 44